MTRALGGLPGENRAGEGANTNMMVDATTEYDPFTGQPRMSAIPVGISRLPNPTS